MSDAGEKKGVRVSGNMIYTVPSVRELRTIVIGQVERK